MPQPLVDDFKLAMRSLASTVHIITSVSDGQRIGMTATAVSSLSMEPPSLVVSIHRSASLHDIIAASGMFCVNVLSPTHNDLVHPFSGKAKGEDRFSFGQWENHAMNGLPCLADALANVACVVDAQLAYGTHTLFVGRVEAIRFLRECNPLVWQNGRTVSTHPMAEPPPKGIEQAGHA
jgi:flavin reductase (DIM6/NTAB) family NADH-FMN oxidoreductase RutF